MAENGPNLLAYSPYSVVGSEVRIIPRREFVMRTAEPKPHQINIC
jgi:hypothetical protein